jgi:hypothetical protein
MRPISRKCRELSEFVKVDDYQRAIAIVPKNTEDINYVTSVPRGSIEVLVPS